MSTIMVAAGPVPYVTVAAGLAWVRLVLFMYHHGDCCSSIPIM